MNLALRAIIHHNSESRNYTSLYYGNSRYYNWHFDDTLMEVQWTPLIVATAGPAFSGYNN